MVQWSDQKLGEAAVSEFRQVTGFDARPLSIEREHMPAWDRSWASVSRAIPPPGIRFAANWESRPGIPGRLAQAERLAGELAGEIGGGTVQKSAAEAHPPRTSTIRR